MQVYGIKIRYTDQRVFDDERDEPCNVLLAAREAIAQSIGLDNVVGTRASHSLDETFFLVSSEELAFKASMAVDRIPGIQADYVPLDIWEETQAYHGMKIILPDNLNVMGLP